MCDHRSVQGKIQLYIFKIIYYEISIHSIKEKASMHFFYSANALFFRFEGLALKTKSQ